MPTHRNPYERFSRDELIPQDQLALDRTVLASERTVLAYIRTAIFLLVTGLSLLKLFDDPAATIAGWGFIAATLLIALCGLIRFRRIRRCLAALEK